MRSWSSGSIALPMTERLRSCAASTASPPFARSRCKDRFVHLYLARHAETTWNLAGRYQGRRESALSGRGIRQGGVLADALAAIEPRIERIIASPLLRTRATALFVAERLNLTVETDDALVEIEHG